MQNRERLRGFFEALSKGLTSNKQTNKKDKDKDRYGFMSSIHTVEVLGKVQLNIH